MPGQRLLVSLLGLAAFSVHVRLPAQGYTPARKRGPWGTTLVGFHPPPFLSAALLFSTLPVLLLAIVAPVTGATTAWLHRDLQSVYIDFCGRLGACLLVTHKVCVGVLWARSRVTTTSASACPGHLFCADNNQDLATHTTRAMAATTVLATATASSATVPDSTICACPSCGLALDLPPLPEAQAALLQAQRQIAELQAQLRVLNQKVAASASSGTTAATTNTTAAAVSARPPSSNSNSASPRSSFLGTGRISQLLGGARSSNSSQSAESASSGATTATATSTPPPPPAKDRPTTPATGTTTAAATPGGPGNHNSNADELLKELLREKKLRAAAEARVDNTSKEVEELSVTLFEQANEMVATERRARAKLEERVSVLEQRDVEKRVRLDRLEGAMSRLDRVRALLGDKGADGSGGAGGAGAAGAAGAAGTAG
ncbi:uncharacterized protein B0I36DRAFT_348105 [Microdochium trichocladiopsis]|uniref:GDP/GTP exchange factor Sec2 N-terminal domain-containing protein n=1 Tax=Microdochium trichocladiopsis TaxID=1682393 RepID=A0A9P8Y9D2_9PEZI|nr:uncharacterized protein B0I36DRAFT_348105 [Microdochium trichocladiopsis]KAH7032971.1 hypothetical protein B0I36DRAFT_348105 [Microdochium trichocladiopsis]